MRKNANIFFAMIGTEFIDTLLEASCKELLENIKTFSKNFENLEVWEQYPYLGMIVKKHIYHNKSSSKRD